MKTIETNQLTKPFPGESNHGLNVILIPFSMKLKQFKKESRRRRHPTSLTPLKNSTSTCIRAYYRMHYNAYRITTKAACSIWTKKLAMKVSTTFSKKNTQLLIITCIAVMSSIIPNSKHLHTIQQSLKKSTLPWLEERQWRHMAVMALRDSMQMNGGEYWQHSNHRPLISAKQLPDLRLKLPLNA